jgi:hypothetical protein
MDELYCDGLLRRASQHRLPVIVVINKVRRQGQFIVL